MFQGICNHKKVAHFTVSLLMTLSLTIEEETATAGLNMAYQQHYVVI